MNNQFEYSNKYFLKNITKKCEKKPKQGILSNSAAIK